MQFYYLSHLSRFNLTCVNFSVAIVGSLIFTILFYIYTKSLYYNWPLKLLQTILLSGPRANMFKLRSGRFGRWGRRRLSRRRPFHLLRQDQQSPGAAEVHRVHPIRAAAEEETRRRLEQIEEGSCSPGNHEKKLRAACQIAHSKK